MLDPISDILGSRLTHSMSCQYQNRLNSHRSHFSFFLFFVECFILFFSSYSPLSLFALFLVFTMFDFRCKLLIFFGPKHRSKAPWIFSVSPQGTPRNGRRRRRTCGSCSTAWSMRRSASEGPKPRSWWTSPAPATARRVWPRVLVFPLAESEFFFDFYVCFFSRCGLGVSDSKVNKTQRNQIFSIFSI